ncbi:hypothetical protein MKX01_001887 [Papaver californicum]|nr:hypothetical protein MKX01_001887 [Papaver californicum]
MKALLKSSMQSSESVNYPTYSREIIGGRETTQHIYSFENNGFKRQRIQI